MTATATYTDPYAGDVTVTVEAFRAKRMGKYSTRYRWVCRTHTGVYAHMWRVPFASVERAIAAAQAAPGRFSNIVKG